MARGTPDYGNNNNQVAVSVTDNSEIVAALVGHNRVDGRGRVAWRDDFSSGLNRWYRNNGGGGIKAAYDYAIDYQIGAYAPVKLDPVASAGFTNIRTSVLLAGTKRIGLETFIRSTVNNSELTFNLNATYINGVEAAGRFTVTPGTYTFKITASDGDHTIYTPPTISQLWNQWVSVKFVVDIEERQWIRAIIGAKEIDLSDYELTGSSVYDAGRLYLHIQALGQGGGNILPWYLSHVIITGDEP